MSDPADPRVLAKKVPMSLRTFEDWFYSDGGAATGLKDYLEDMNLWLECELGEVPDGLALEVMKLSAGDASSWYRGMMHAV